MKKFLISIIYILIIKSLAFGAPATVQGAIQDVRSVNVQDLKTLENLEGAGN